MGASHSVEATDTKAEEAVETPLPEIEEEEEENETFMDEVEMNWFWPFI
jgi:hypothetical protein